MASDSKQISVTCLSTKKPEDYCLLGRSDLEMIGNIICFIIGAMCGVFSLALLQINRGDSDE